MYVYVSKIKDENTLREGNGGMEWRGKGNDKIKQNMIKVRWSGNS